jgi:poly [ADP-ribose] polymerase
MAHMIEVAKSGRAACRGCKAKIDKDTLRFGEAFANQFGEGDSYRWYHLKCAAQKVPAALEEALAGYSGEVPDRPQLEQLIATGKASKQASTLPFVDHAPTGRAKCMQCEQAIEKGSLRVAVEREVDTGAFTSKGAGYLHPGCVRASSQAAERNHDELVAAIRAHSALPSAELDQALAAMA